MSPDGTMQDFEEAAKMENLGDYLLGAEDLNRPWGAWRVTKHPLCKDGFAITQERLNSEPHLVPVEAEKEIVVKPIPEGALSLQKHKDREEYWTVISGTLSAILNGVKVKKEKGQTLFIPRGSFHCILNDTDQPVVVHEIQKGKCREIDNIRITDVHARADGGVTPDDELINITIQTLQDRYSKQDFAPDDDHDMINIYMQYKDDEADLKNAIQNVLDKSRDIYQPYVVRVAEAKATSQQKCAVK